jgi:hypothetical protein
MSSSPLFGVKHASQGVSQQIKIYKNEKYKTAGYKHPWRVGQNPEIAYG